VIKTRSHDLIDGRANAIAHILHMLSVLSGRSLMVERAT